MGPQGKKQLTGLRQAHAMSLRKVGRRGLAGEHSPPVQAVFSPHRPPLLDVRIQGTALVSRYSGSESNVVWEEGEAHWVTDWVF